MTMYYIQERNKGEMMQLTWLDSNSWSIELGGKKILLDPWLVGDLTFGNLPWLFRGTKTVARAIPEHIDLILLSQGLPDHAHLPTLEALDRSIPVLASPSAAKVVRGLGYQQVTAIAPGESEQWAGIEIQAVPGSPVGPGAIENGYILRHGEDSLYYEPHGYHHPSLADQGPIEVIITPTINLMLPLLGAVIKGQESALQVCETLQPRFILPTAAGGDVDFSGLLMQVLKAEGTGAEFQKMLRDRGLATELIELQPWQPWSLGDRAAAKTADRIPG
jgi:L-ascorbate metabolism protein UlaG (beta-lactamase superfamily)